MSTSGNTQRQHLTVRVALEFILMTSRPGNRLPRGLNGILDRIYAEQFRGRCSMPGCKENHAYLLPFSRTAEASHSWTASGRTAPELDGMALVSKKDRAKLSVWWKRAQREQWGAASDHEMYLAPERTISDVLGRLRGINSRPGTNRLMGIFANDTCNFRITIESDGSGQDPPLSLSTLKNILKTMLLQERSFDAIRSYPTIKTGAVDMSRAIGMIEAASTYTDLVLLSATFFPSVATRILSQTPKRFRGVTFEYDGTLNEDEIIHHLNMTKSVLHWCKITPTDDLDEFLFSKFADLSYSFLDFLEIIRVPGYTKGFFAHKLSPTYSRETYQRTVAPIAKHSPIWVLLDHVARCKVLNSDFTTVGMCVLEKMMRGEYGWSLDDLENVAARDRSFVGDGQPEYVGYSIRVEERADSVMGFEVPETNDKEDE